MAEHRTRRVHRAEVPDSWREASAELTEQIRRLGRLAALTEADEQTLRSTAGQIADLNSRLDGELRAGVLAGDFDQGRTGSVRSIGAHNVRVIPLEITVAGEQAVARFQPDELSEGAAGLLHGGEAGWLMDCMFGLLIEELGTVSRTASLTLDYRAPTPLDTPLTLRSAVERREGRKLWVAGSIEAHGVTTVEAHGLFIIPRA